MSKDPFQILADELTLIRKDMDQLQRTSLNKDEAKTLNQIVTAAVMKMAKASEDAPGEIQEALEADRDQMARSATQAATRAADSAMAGIRHDLSNEHAKLSQAAGEARREAWHWFGGFLGVVGLHARHRGRYRGAGDGMDTRARRCPRVRAVSTHLLWQRRWTGGRAGQWVQLLRHLDQSAGTVKISPAMLRRR
jgi:hypothetical protein